MEEINECKELIEIQSQLLEIKKKIAKFMLLSEVPQIEAVIKRLAATISRKQLIISGETPTAGGE